MLTSELQNKIDQKWDVCWPINELRPIVILDLISYLFFIKKINANQLAIEKTENKSDADFSNSIRNEYFKDSFFIDPEDNSKHPLFDKENGDLSLKKNYSQDLTYGLYVKGDVLMIPTHKLSCNAEEILKIIEEGDDHLKGEIFDYLLNKAELTGNNGQAYLPEFLVKLIVSLIQPSEKDSILNPAAGNGNLLTGCTKYITRENRYSQNSQNNFDPRKFVGLESDLTGLRIAAMNMMLHGIHNPELKIPDTSASLKDILLEQPSIIVANLIFISDDDKMNIEINSGNEASSKAIYYLNFILKNLATGIRAVIIVPDTILYNTGAGFISIRREIADKCKLDTVLYLGEKKFSHFYGTSVLIFSKETSAKTDKVWFYKIENDGMNIDNEHIVPKNGIENNAENNSKQHDEFENVLNHFKKKSNKKKNEKQVGFYVNMDEIRSKGYNLSYKEYHPIKREKKSISLSKTISGEKKETINKIMTHNNVPLKNEKKEVINERNPDNYFPSSETKSNKKREVIADSTPKQKVPFKATFTDKKEKITNILIRVKIPSLTIPAKKKETTNTITNQSLFKEAVKKTSSKKVTIEKIIFLTSLSILFICISYLIYWMLYLKNDSTTQKKSIVIPEVVSDSAIKSSLINPGSFYAMDSIINVLNKYASADSANQADKKYTVISKAFFYSSPVQNTKQRLFINNLNNDTLTPLKEKNGFIYVVYISNNGKITNGWLNKKDLATCP